MAEKPQRTIYLDLDGVIFPYFWQPELNTNWIDTDEIFYYQDITKRIGQIAARGVRVLPSSSRSIDLFLYYPEVLADIGGGDRYLSIDRRNPADIGFKAMAVFNNFKGAIDFSDERRGWERHIPPQDNFPLVKPAGSRAVWIDDHATPDKLLQSEAEQARHILDEPSIKIINPLGSLGLTLTQLDEAEEFLFKM